MALCTICGATSLVAGVVIDFVCLPVFGTTECTGLSEMIYGTIPLSELKISLTAPLPYALSFCISYAAARLTAPKRLHIGADYAMNPKIFAQLCNLFLHGVVIVPMAYTAMGPFWSSEDLTLSTASSVRCCDIYVGYLMAESFILCLL